MKVNNKIGRLSVESVGKEFRTGDEGQTTKIPNKAALNAILELYSSFIDVVDSRKSAVEDLAKARTDAIKAGDDLAKAADGNWFKEKWTQAKLQVVLRLVNLNLSQSLSSYTSYAFKVSRAGLIYTKAAVAAA